MIGFWTLKVFVTQRWYIHEKDVSLFEEFSRIKNEKVFASWQILQKADHQSTKDTSSIVLSWLGNVLFSTAQEVREGRMADEEVAYEQTASDYHAIIKCDK